MKKYYLLPVLAFAATGLIIYLICEYYSWIHVSTFTYNYSNKFQVPLFTGFLTISGFLLSLTTFIVVKMHEAVYQDKNYYESVETYKRIDPNYSQTESLENLNTFLITSVVIALIASFSQLTIGNYPSFYAIIFCLAIVAAAATFVLTSCYLIKLNMSFWIAFMKKKKEEEYSKKANTV